MNKFLRLLFVLVIIAMLGASISQIFHHTQSPGYGIRHGIGIWNLAVLILILGVNIKYDYDSRIVLRLIFGGLGTEQSL